MKKAKTDSKSERKMKTHSDISALQTIHVRLDALVMLMIKANYTDENGKIKLREAAPLLHLAGYTPTEIASLLGKKKRTEITQYLY